jgi:hypothetical protein
MSSLQDLIYLSFMVAPVAIEMLGEPGQYHTPLLSSGRYLAKTTVSIEVVLDYRLWRRFERLVGPISYRLPRKQRFCQWRKSSGLE